MDGGDHGRRNQIAVSQREKIKMVVDEVEVIGALKAMGDVQPLPDLRVERRIVRIAARADCFQLGACVRIGAGKERDLQPARDQPLRQGRNHLFPGTVMPRGHTPGNRRQHGNTESRRHNQKNSSDLPEGLVSLGPTCVAANVAQGFPFTEKKRG
jgi:hypothetical protein